MKYLKYFSKDSDYQSFMEGGNVILPNVSFVQEDNYVGYKPYVKLPLIKATYNNEGTGHIAINNMDNVKRLWVDGAEIIFEPITERNNSLNVYSARISGGYDWYSVPSDYYLNDNVKSVVLTPMNESLSEVENIICASYGGSYWDFFDVNNTEYFIKDETANSVSIKQSFFENIFAQYDYSTEYDGKKKVFICLGKRDGDWGNAIHYDTLINYIGIGGGVPKRYTFENNDIPHYVEIELKNNYIGDMFENARGLVNIELPDVITESNFSFSECSKLSSIIFNAPKITCIDVKGLFYDCFELTSLDLSNWDTSNVRDMTNLFSGCFLLDSFVDTIKNWDVHNVTSMYSMFSRSNVTSINLSNWDTSNVTSMESLFWNCSSLTSIDLSKWNTSNVTNMHYMFSGCRSLISVNLSDCDISKVTGMDQMFSNCTSLTEVKMGGDPSSLIGVYYMFDNISTNGTFYYNPVYDYSKIIAKLPSTWTALPLYENIQCTELTITADDASGRATSTTIYYTATLIGNCITDGSVVTWTKTGIGRSSEFEQNLSETDSRQVEVSFTYEGKTATTTITQGVWINKGYSIDLNSQWQLSSVISNPDSSTYNGVYESYSNTGIDDSAAIMYIDIVGYETFKLYIRSYAESAYDYVMVSQLDQTITSESSYSDADLVKAHTSGNQNGGTEIDNYTLVEFTGIDGGEHRITVLYRKDGSAASDDDRGYLLIPKNQ